METTMSKSEKEKSDRIVAILNKMSPREKEIVLSHMTGVRTGFLFAKSIND